MTAHTPTLTGAEKAMSAYLAVEGPMYTEGAVERIVAARVAAARADERERLAASVGHTRRIPCVVWVASDLHGSPVSVFSASTYRRAKKVRGQILRRRPDLYVGISEAWNAPQMPPASLAQELDR